VEVGRCRARRAFLMGIAVVSISASLVPLAASAQQFEIKAVAEKKVTKLPAGSLFWLVENFPTLAQAQTAASDTTLVAEAAGKVWSFTLSPKGGSLPGGALVADIGPVPAFSAPEYLLRINIAGGPPGVKTPVHSHPGSESFYVLTGELSQKTPDGTSHVSAGKSMPGHVPGTAMQVSSTGSSDLSALVMFVTDATKPFSSPTTMP
jgi:quercetin dioxygenase-like cupin family protein